MSGPRAVALDVRVKQEADCEDPTVTASKTELPSFDEQTGNGTSVELPSSCIETVATCKEPAKSGDDAFKCGRCNHGVIHMNHLKELDVFIIPSDGHLCGVCKCLFPSGDDLRRHMKEHVNRGHGDRSPATTNLRTQISSEGKTVGSRNELNKPGLLGNKANVCYSGSGGNVFQRRKYPKKFVCGDCDFESDHLWNYKRHIVKHGGELPYKCALCSYGTSIKVNLDVHVRRNHTKDKPYKCALCPYENAVIGRLREHEFAKHNIDKRNIDKRSARTRDKKYKCARCFYQSDYAGNLKRHEFVHTS